MTRLQRDLVQPGSAVPTTKATAVTIRTFQHNDYARVLDICRNVYGGTDYMPRLIHHFSTRPETTVLVSQAATGPDSVNGIMCSHKRGSACFLFGLRVAEEDRGKGLARALMEAISQKSEDFGPINLITTATIPQQPAAIRLFDTMGFVHTHTVDVWPSFEALSQYEQLVDVQLTESAPDPAQLQQQPNMLDVLGFQSMLVEQNSVQLQGWVQCSSEQQLHEAVESIRTQQLKQAELQQVAPILPVEHLPWAYETFPLDAPWTLRSLAEGRIWLLPCSKLQDHGCSSSDKPTDNGSSGSKSTVSSTDGSRSCSTSSLNSLNISISNEAGRGRIGDASQPATCDNHCRQQYAALVVTDFSIEMRRYCAGVMTADDAYIAGAIQLIASQLPHFLCFCDRGSRHSSGKPDPHVVLPAVIAETGRPSCFIPYARESESLYDLMS